jgi:hypothetical protein
MSELAHYDVLVKGGMAGVWFYADDAHARAQEIRAMPGVMSTEVSKSNRTELFIVVDPRYNKRDVAIAVGRLFTQDGGDPHLVGFDE